MSQDELNIRKSISNLVPEIVKLVVPIYRDSNGRPEQIGSGFFIHKGNETALVSAAHVLNILKKETLYYYSKPSVSRKITGLLISTDETESDVGVVIFKEEPYPPHKEVDKYVTPEKYYGPNRIPRGEKHYVIVGFPATQSKTKPGKKETHVVPYAYHDFSIPDVDYPKFGLTPKRSIAMNLDLRKGINPNMERINFPKPQGMSGSPIWEIFDNEAPNPDETVNLYLAGIGIEYHNSRKLLIGSDINNVLEMLKST